MKNKVSISQEGMSSNAEPLNLGARVDGVVKKNSSIQHFAQKSLEYFEMYSEGKIDRIELNRMMNRLEVLCIAIHRQEIILGVDSNFNYDNNVTSTLGQQYYNQNFIASPIEKEVAEENPIETKEVYTPTGLYKKGMHTQTCTSVEGVKEAIVKELQEVARQQGFIVTNIQIENV
jgi:hypothetical protein